MAPAEGTGLVTGASCTHFSGGPKFAVTVWLPLISTVQTIEDPEHAPLQYWNSYPAAGVATTVTSVPAKYVGPGCGDANCATVPLPAVVAVSVNVGLAEFAP